MQRYIRDGLSNLLRSFLLWGYGWQRRTRREGDTRHREWRDPSSGHWYSGPAAQRRLEDQLLSIYDVKGRPRRPFSLRC